LSLWKLRESEGGYGFLYLGYYIFDNRKACGKSYNEY
jgi:hypothetical protein